VRRCLEARDLRAALAAHKSNYACDIAEVLRTGRFKAVHAKAEFRHESRLALRASKDACSRTCGCQPPPPDEERMPTDVEHAQP
jgi:hypothetical protein